MKEKLTFGRGFREISTPVNADSTWETDQFLVNCYIGVKCVRPLSRDGMPY